MQMTEPPILYFHADDYGMTAHGDALIRDCQTHGCLNSVSIVPNGSLEEAIAALRPSGLKLAVHLNLVEGKALSLLRRSRCLSGQTAASATPSPGCCGSR